MPQTASAARSPLLGHPGAVAGNGPDAAVAGHYGDPLGEQRRLLRGEPVLVDRSHRSVVRVTGPDRLPWLHSLLSQHLETLPPDVAREALLLSPHGHIEQHMAISDDGEATWIDLEPGQGAAFVAYLDSMRFMLRVEVSDRSADVAVLTVGGSADQYDVPDLDLVGARRLPWGLDLLLPRDRMPAVVEAAGCPLVGHEAFEAVRVAARRPRLGFETDHRTIPHELGWLETAVHLEKGCYRGQETVARVHNLGRPPRRLILLHLDGSREQLPATGSQLTLEGRPVGFVGTAVWHAELGQIALAMVKRQVPDEAVLDIAGVAAAVEPA